MNTIEFIESITGFKYYSGNSPAEFIYDYLDAFFEEYQNYYIEDYNLPSYKIKNFVQLIRSGISINELTKKIGKYWESKNLIIYDYQIYVLNVIHQTSKYNNYKWFTDYSPLSVFHLSGKRLKNFIKENCNIEIKDYQFKELKTISDLVNFIASYNKINAPGEKRIISVRVEGIQNNANKQISSILQCTQNEVEPKKIIEEEKSTNDFFYFENIVFNEE